MKPNDENSNAVSGAMAKESAYTISVMRYDELFGGIVIGIHEVFNPAWSESEITTDLKTLTADYPADVSVYNYACEELYNCHDNFINSVYRDESIRYKKLIVDMFYNGGSVQITLPDSNSRFIVENIRPSEIGDICVNWKRYDDYITKRIIRLLDMYDVRGTYVYDTDKMTCIAVNAPCIQSCLNYYEQVVLRAERTHTVTKTNIGRRSSFKSDFYTLYVVGILEHGENVHMDRVLGHHDKYADIIREYILNNPALIAELKKLEIIKDVGFLYRLT